MLINNPFIINLKGGDKSDADLDVTIIFHTTQFYKKHHNKGMIFNEKCKNKQEYTK